MVTFLSVYDGRIYVFLSICEFYSWFFLPVLAHLTQNGEKLLWYVYFCEPWKSSYVLYSKTKKFIWDQSIVKANSTFWKARQTESIECSLKTSCPFSRSTASWWSSIWEQSEDQGLQIPSIGSTWKLFLESSDNAFCRTLAHGATLPSWQCWRCSLQKCAAS